MKLFDTFAYILLGLTVIVAAASLMRFRFDPNAQFLIVELLLIFYLVWGVIYHNIKKDLKKEIILEYIAISAIASVVGLLVFFL